MRKILLGLAAASVALPAVATAQPGYYGSYGGATYAHPADRNRDGVVTRREAKRFARLQQRYARQQQRQAERYYGSNSRYYGNGYGSSQGYYGNGYGSNQGYYGNSYGSNQGYYGNNYSQYYDRSGYYSGPTWRGDDGRYYCHRSDGTTGTIVGGAAGALVGSQVAGRGDSTLGAIIGGAIGAVIGNSVDRGGNGRNRCR